MVKVNGGVYRDQNLTGSLRAFVIKLANIEKAVATAADQPWKLASGDDAKYNIGDAVPGTLADIAIRAISTRATVVSVEFKTGEMHVLLENASGWDDGMAVGDAGAVAPKGTAKSLKTFLFGDATALPPAVGLFKGETDTATQTKYSASGAAVGAVTNADIAAATVTQCKLVFDATATATYLEGLGGNEHN